MKIALVKSSNRLTPAYNRDKDNLGKLKDGIYEFSVRRDRFLPHHRKFWAILACVCANCDKWQIPEQLLIALKIKLGYFNVVPGIDGAEIIAPGSIRFESMDQDSFERFYSAALPILADVLGCTVEELENNAGEYM